MIKDCRECGERREESTTVYGMCEECAERWWNEPVNRVPKRKKEEKKPVAEDLADYGF